MGLGRVKIHRKMLNREWYSDPNAFRVFFHLILTANNVDKRWHGIVIKRWQIITSLWGISKQLQLWIKQVRNALKKLESTWEILKKTTNKYSLITVVKYCDYNDKPEENDQQRANERQAEGKQRATTKEYKEYKEWKEINPKGSNIADAGDENFENPPEEDSDLEEYLPEEKILPTPNPLPKKTDTDRKEKVLHLLSVFKEACQEAGLQYISWKYETTSIRNLYSDKFQESIKKYNMTTEEFIKNIIKCSVRPYMPDVSSPLKFYQNRWKVINTIRKEKEKLEEERKRNEATKRKIVKLS